MFLLFRCATSPPLEGLGEVNGLQWRTYTMQTLISFWKLTALVVDVFVQFSNTLLNVFV